MRLAGAAAVSRIGPYPFWSYGHRVAGRVAAFTLRSEALPAPSVASFYDRGVPDEGK